MYNVSDIIMPLDGHAAVDYITVGPTLDIPPMWYIYLWPDHTVDRYDYK